MTRLTVELTVVWVALFLAVFPGLAAPAEAGQAPGFPPTTTSYNDPAGGSCWTILKHRAVSEPFNMAATLLFLLAITHTFLAPLFERLSHKYRLQHQQSLPAVPAKQKTPVCFRAELFHFLGEVEAIFGIWVIPLLIALSLCKGWPTARNYIGQGLSFVEPLFVVVIMTIAASRPILKLAERVMALGARLGGGTVGAWWFSVLAIGPILGSVITEPAAMTISALLLAKRFYQYHPSPKLAYATLGLLFVNVSIGGTLTHFAAPPVLMVAGKWGWGSSHMFTEFGWKALTAILIANSLYALKFSQELRNLQATQGPAPSESDDEPLPVWLTIMHLLFLAWTVLNNHYPVLFIGGFLFFLAFVQATDHHQSEVCLRPALLVGFFLAGLVVHGGLQGWWIGPVLSSLSTLPLYFSAVGLTAFNDNAAITYLASLAPDFGPALQYTVVAGAVAGGGLTVIANAPNPAGQSILSRFFPEGISAWKLFLGALVPTVVASVCFLLLR